MSARQGQGHQVRGARDFSAFGKADVLIHLECSLFAF